MSTTSKNTKSKDANEVVEAQTGGAVATTEYDYSEYAGQGFENHNRDDYAVPFLGVIQSNSPIIEVNAEARPGMLINTVTKELYDGKNGILFIPVATTHNVLEWKPRDAGGGFVATHEMSSDIVKTAQKEQEFGKWKSVKGDIKSNDLIETYSVYGIFATEDGGASQMIISFSSTKIKTYKAWMTKARTVQVPLPDGRRVTPPLFAHKFRISTVKETNPKGSYYNFTIEFDGGDATKCRLPTNSPLFGAAKAFSDLIKEGSVKVAHESQATTVSDEAGVVDDNQIPFE